MLRYLSVFLVSAMLALPVGYLAIWTVRIADCRFLSDPDTFLATCQSPKFGNYEHGAYVYHLEPAAIAALRAADVLFVGNSRMQFGFSTEATRHFFSERKASYYLLGFGYTEQSEFIVRLIERERLRPRMLIVNVDFFPGNGMSVPATAVLSEWSAIPEHAGKAGAMRVRTFLCPWFCRGTWASIYRSRTNGAWIWADIFIPGDNSIPILENEREKLRPEYYDVYYTPAVSTLLSRAAVARQCVVVTSTPNSTDSWEGLASHIARKFGVTAVLPELENLQTVDRSHLNLPSAERWSAAVLNEATPIFAECLARR